MQRGVQPRKLDPKAVQRILFERGALVGPERIGELESAKLPSGRTVKQLYEDEFAGYRNYWRSRGEPV